MLKLSFVVLTCLVLNFLSFTVSSTTDIKATEPPFVVVNIQSFEINYAEKGSGTVHFNSKQFIIFFIMFQIILFRLCLFSFFSILDSFAYQQGGCKSIARKEK